MDGLTGTAELPSHESAVAADQRVPAVTRAASWLEIGLATLSGLLCFIACSYFEWHLLAWVALLPLLWVLDNTTGMRRALLLSWWGGTVASFGTCDWMMLLLQRFSSLPQPAVLGAHLLYSAYQGTAFVLFAWVVRAGRTRLALPMTAVAPAAMVAAQFMVPFLFPYGLEMSQAFATPVIQIADLLGRLGVVALLVLVNAALYDLQARHRLLPRRRPSKAPAVAGMAIAALLVSSAFGYAWLRMARLDAQLLATPGLRIGVLQPNVPYDSPIEDRAVSEQQRITQRAARLADMRDRSRELAERGAQLVVWSETGYPFKFARQQPHDFASGDWRSVSAGIGVPLIAGAFTYEGDRPQQQVYNSALLIDADGLIVQRYDKNVLVPLGEYLPALLDSAWMRALMLGMGGALHAGHDPHPLTLQPAGAGPTLRLGILICYEDVLPALTRQVGRQHPNLLVNLSNDAWFSVSTEQWEHLAMAVYAAVEQRTSMVRAVNPGVSAFIDPLGRLRARTQVVDPGSAGAQMQTQLARLPLLSGGYTAYDAIGDWFAYGCALWCMAVLIGAGVRHRRTAPEPSS
jgi:apolipoprotein N-acyltransferase